MKRRNGSYFEWHQNMIASCFKLRKRKSVKEQLFSSSTSRIIMFSPKFKAP